MRIIAILLFASFIVSLSATAQSFEDSVEAAKKAMMVDPSEALEYAEQAEQLIVTESGVDRATAQWLQSEALKRMNRLDAAMLRVQSAQQALAETDKTSKLYGDLLVAEAGIAAVQSDYVTALENYQSAHDLFMTLGESRAQAMSLFHVADIHADARDFDKALSFYARAQEAYSDDPQIELARLNNVATAHRELGRYSDALLGLEQALEIASEMDSTMLQARILTNIAAVQLDAGDLAAARASLQRAQDLETANPSGWQGPITGMWAKLAYAEGDIAAARRFIDEVFLGFDLTTTPAPFLEFHEAAFKIYGAVDAPRQALDHLTAFKRLDDEKRNVAANANTALLSAEFDFATQELQIARLRTETLEAEVNLRETRTRQRLIIFTGLALMMLAALIAGLFHYRKMKISRDQVNDANTQLNRSNKALEKALKAKSEFLATTSHEIRTPLNAILGMSQLISVQKGLDAKTQERVQLVHSSGLTMKAIVDDILDMTKIESGTISVHEAPCKIADTLQSVAEVWRGRAAEKNLQLISHFEHCPIEATTDERKLRQIVLNLMSNAVKFTEAGTVEITAKLADAAAEPTLVVSISDTGCGIPNDKFEHIFEPFTQIDSSTTRHFAGTGLGLSIARNFAHALDGDISVESDTGRGSVFILRIPLKAVMTAETDATPQALDVLLIEPNFLRQSILEALLESQNKTYLTLNEIEALDEVPPTQTVNALFVSKDLDQDDASQFLETVQTLSDRFDEADFILEKSTGCTLEDGLLRISGVTAILPEGSAPLNIISHLGGASNTENNPSESDDGPQNAQVATS